MWSKFAIKSNQNKEFIIWRRIRKNKEEFTVTEKLQAGIPEIKPRETAGYYSGREGLRKVMGINLG